MDLISKERRKELKYYIRCAGWKISVDSYVRKVLYFTVGIGLLAFLLFYVLLMFDPVNSLAFSFLFMIVFYIIVLNIPKYFSKVRSMVVESELPVLLRALSTELAIGIPFESAVHSVSLLEDKSRVFRQLDAELKNLGPLDAIEKVRSSYDSRLLDKALSHLAFIYSYGYEESGLSKLVDEISSLHKSRIKEFASRSSMMGVLLITVSSVVPALATTYILIGSSFMDVDLSDSDIYLFYIIGLPIVTLGMLLSIRALSPATSKRGVDFLSEEELRKFRVFLSNYGINVPPVRFMIYLFFASLLLSLLLFYFTESPMSFMALLIPLAVYGIFLYLDDLRISQVEDFMPDALFYVSSLHNLGLEKAVEEISKANYGELSKEFERASRQIEAGFSIRVAMNSIIERNRSPIVERGISLLVKIHEIGASLEKALRSTAEDIYDLFMLMKERESILSMQRYNLLVAALILPAIFGAVLTLVKSMDLDYLSEFMGGNTSKDLLPAVEFSMQIYVGEFALLSSIFLADYSGSWKRFVVYLVFLLPVMFFLYSIGGQLLFMGS